LDEGKQSISIWTGTFLDNSLEHRFQKLYLGLRTDYLRKISLIVGSLFLSFFIWDFISLKTFSVLVTVFVSRLGIFTLSCFFYFHSSYFLKSSAFLKITIYEFAFIVSFFIIIGVYEKPSFLFQCLAINIIVLGIYFLVPNLLINKVILSFALSACFLGIALTKFYLPLREVIYTFGYFTLSIVFSIVCSYNLDKYMRLDFVNKQCLIENSTRDPLTNAYNRLKFNQSLISHIELAKRYGNIFSLIMFDIDHFKKLNDENGHIFGDRVLIEITDLVKECVREVDIFARWGGEEFVIILPQTNCTEASALAERLRKVIWEESAKKNRMITCSFGVTSFLNDRDDIHSIMNRVDRALYRAKENGRNVVVTEDNIKKSE
jgi:diguanylate cyclase (GGDEF) domain